MKSTKIAPEVFETAVRRFEPWTLPDPQTGQVKGRAWLHTGAVYTGTFVENTMEGHGMYEWADRVTYDGQFKANEATGHGRMAWPGKGGWRYEGSFEGAQRHGSGECVGEAAGVAYRGEWRRGLREGRGSCTSAEGWQYDGDWLAGKRHGKGAFVWKSGSVYGGEWRAGEKHGWGIVVWKRLRQVYAGEWECGHAHGKGTHYYGLGDSAIAVAEKAARACEARDPLAGLRLRVNCYAGQWKEGERHGRGTFVYADGTRYTGNWSHNEKDGDGAVELEDGRVISGRFSSDRAPADTEARSPISVALAEVSGAQDAVKQFPAVMTRFGGELRQLYDEVSASSASGGRRLVSSWQFAHLLNSLGLASGGVTHAELLRSVARLLDRGSCRHPGATSGFFERPFSPLHVLLPHEFSAGLLCAVLVSRRAQSVADAAAWIASAERLASLASSRRRGGSIDAALDDPEIEAALDSIYEKIAIPRRSSPGHLGHDGDRTASLRDVLGLCSCPECISIAVSAISASEEDPGGGPGEFDVDRELCFFEFAETVAKCATAISAKLEPTPDAASAIRLFIRNSHR